MTKTVLLNTIDESGSVTNCCAIEPRPIAISDEEAASLANQFKALADPFRIQILNLLSACDEPVCVCEITPRFAIGQSTISHHLKILRDAGLIAAERRGTFMYYRLEERQVAHLPEAMRAVVAVPVQR